MNLSWQLLAWKRWKHVYRRQTVSSGLGDGVEEDEDETVSKTTGWVSEHWRLARDAAPAAGPEHPGGAADSPDAWNFSFPGVCSI